MCRSDHVTSTFIGNIRAWWAIVCTMKVMLFCSTWDLCAVLVISMYHSELNEWLISNHKLHGNCAVGRRWSTAVCNLVFLVTFTVYIYHHIIIIIIRRYSLYSHRRSPASVCGILGLSAAWQNQTGWNYNHQTCPSWVLPIHLTLGQKDKGQSHRVTNKCKNILKAIEWLAWVCTLWSDQTLVNTAVSCNSACQCDYCYQSCMR